MFFYWLTKVLFVTLAKVFFHLKAEGLENLPKQGGFILASNHASSLDPFVMMAAIPRYIRWTVIYEYYDQAHLRWILERMRFIRIEANLPKQTFRALKAGDILGMFPEGRRSWDGKLCQANRGVAALARRTHVPVVPVAIEGTFQALPRTRKSLKLHPITVRIGKPLYFTECAKVKKDEFQIDEENTRKLMQVISELLEKGKC